ncbi:membrane protein insertase YidC [Candidatus Peregrinibacteria bacterium]|nr:MAG: membrane protein insertase YidC [Candidatus Peregrinibacteria bacterium]
MKNFKLLPYLLIFLSTFLILQWFQGEKQEDPALSTPEIGLKTVKDDYVVGTDVQVDVQNNTQEVLNLLSRCPDAPLDVSRFTGEGYEKVESTQERSCPADQEVTTSILPGEKETISLLDYSYSLFGEPGTYRIGLSGYNSPEFSIKEPGLFRTLYRSFIYEPMLNALAGILIYIPGHHLGWAVVILTLIIRTLLLIPSQKGMRAQRRMQELQPKLNALKEKHGQDQTRLAQETMLLWKTHKVSPFSSCLPLLIQMPILIALFHVINGGLSPDKHGLLYSFLPDFSLESVNPSFLGFNLLEHSYVVLPLIVGGLQFLQIQLMNMRKNKSTAALPAEMEAANKMMKYIMPVMIAVFTAQLPAAVGLYWGVSTFYGIVQQLVVNKEQPKTASAQDDVQIRVINRHHGKTN